MSCRRDKYQAHVCLINKLIVHCWMDEWMDGWTICSMHMHCPFSNVLNAILLWSCQNQLPLSLRNSPLPSLSNTFLARIWQELPHSTRVRKTQELHYREEKCMEPEVLKYFSHCKFLFEGFLLLEWFST